ETLLALASQARSALLAEGVPIGDVALGVMLEIPSAVLTAPAWFGRTRFASLGTNDLLQYTLAVDRGNPALERYRDSLHPALLPPRRRLESSSRPSNPAEDPPAPTPESDRPALTLGVGDC